MSAHAGGSDSTIIGARLGLGLAERKKTMADEKLFARIARLFDVGQLGDVKVGVQDGCVEKPLGRVESEQGWTP